MFCFRAAFVLILTVCLSLTAALACASNLVCVVDDASQSVCASPDVKRVVSLAPHTTELVAYSGGLDRLVGVDTASNYPPSVQSLERVGDSQRVDIEQLLALEPDLVVVWGSGTSPAMIDLLRDQEVAVFVSEPTTIQAVAQNISSLATLLGRSDGKEMARLWAEQFDQLKADYSRRTPVKVFYQVWESPLMTIGGKHLINDVIRLCGGTNVFASLDALAPTVSLEAAVAGNPDLIVSSGDQERAMSGLMHWLPWDQVSAVQNEQFAVLPSDVLVRNGPRLIEGAKAMCLAIEEARH